MTFQETKQQLIDFLYTRKRESGEYFRHVSGTEYVTRCPYCGDSTHSLTTGHLYMSIDVDGASKIPCYCQKCSHSGIVDLDLMELIGCTDEDLKNGIAQLNKYGKSKPSQEKENQILYFDRELPREHRYPEKIKYVENRLGISIGKEEIGYLKIITSLYDFLLLNSITESPFKKDMRMLLERDYVGFLSVGNSHILFRDITETHKYPWIKYPIEEECRKNRVMYGINDAIDVYGDQTVIVNLCEGVMDALGIHFHLMNGCDNVMNIAVGGRNYNTLIRYLISLGIIGSNVRLNLYIDNDVVYNNKDGKKRFSERDYWYLTKYKPIFNKINLITNLRNKDYGVKKELIITKKIRI